MVGRDGELHLRQRVEDLLDGDRGDEPRLALRGAGVRAGAPGEVGAVALPVLGGQRGVVVGGGEADDDRLVLGQPHAGEVDVLRRVGHREVGQRRVGPQDLVDRVLDLQVAAGQVAGEPVVGQQQPQAVHDEVLRGLGAGAQEGEDLVHHLLVREARRSAPRARTRRRGRARARLSWTRSSTAARRISLSASALTVSKMPLMPSTRRSPRSGGQPKISLKTSSGRTLRVVGDQVAVALGARTAR